MLLVLLHHSHFGEAQGKIRRLGSKIRTVKRVTPMGIISRAIHTKDEAGYTNCLVLEGLGDEELSVEWLSINLFLLRFRVARSRV